MDDDDVIGSIEGTATFESIKIAPTQDYQKVRVHGKYHGDTTIYETDPKRVIIGGLKLGENIDGAFHLNSDEDGWVWVEATEDELRITSEKP